MKKNLQKTLMISGVLAALMSAPAYAMIKNIEINADLDSIPSYEAGTAFFPEYEVSDDDSDGLSIAFSPEPKSAMSSGNPTIPATLKLTIQSDQEDLDDDLKITGTGIRSTYVDTVSEDNTEATARLLVYPFYELTAPSVTISGSQAQWAEVPYAGKYEIVLTYVNKGGNEVTTHHTTKNCYYSVSAAQANAANGQYGIAVRALPTNDEGYQTLTVANGGIVNGKAQWSALSEFANQYEVKISYTTNGGKKQTTRVTTTETSKDVTAYLNSAANDSLVVTVRAMPKQSDASYYNIASSDWGRAGSYTADTADYEIDDKWEFLSNYQATVNGDFATTVRGSSARFGTTASTGTQDGSWKRVSYHWQYLVNGSAYNQGWRQINGSWYYFDADGYMHTGWLEWNGHRYYLESKIGDTCGQMITGTKQINGTSYTFGADGICQNM